jgi:YVTN family beta-propeller protein
MRAPRLVLLVLLALAPDAARAGAEPRIFVTNEKSDDVTVVDATARAVVATIPVSSR